MKHYTTILKKIRDCPQKNSIYKKINPQLFDVSLRDGIQNAKVENFPTNKKMAIFNSIIKDFQPNKIEIGSLTSSKILPILADSLVLHNYANQYLSIHDKNPEFPDIYVLIPSQNKLVSALQHNIRNFSFITSISDQFQLRNTFATIEETKEEFRSMFHKWFGEPNNYKKKLYISCINKCPIIGKIDNDFIVREILYYHTNYDFNELCLSDTMGSLDHEDFKYIIDTCLIFGIPPSKLSFHFHSTEENKENLEKIIFYCFSKNLNKFDISMLETGGCSVTLNSDKLRPNLSYDLFFNIINKYIDKKIM